MEIEDIYRKLLELVEKSEARIDSTNQMIARLAETCRNNSEMYDKHLCSLERSRDVTQENSTLLLKNYNSLIDEVKELRKELRSAKQRYEKLEEAYIRLSESSNGGNSRSDVRINM